MESTYFRKYYGATAGRLKGERVETKERTTRRRSRCMLSSIEQCFSCANASAGGGGEGYGRRRENRNMCARVGPLHWV